MLKNSKVFIVLHEPKNNQIVSIETVTLSHILYLYILKKFEACQQTYLELVHKARFKYQNKTCSLSRYI